MAVSLCTWAQRSPIHLEDEMEPIVERCCGLDVHQATVVACLLIGQAHQKPKKEVRSFGTKTRELMELRDWLRESSCTHVGMESTGIYWKPVHAILEDDFEVVIGNAHHIKNVPGRKTDVKDSEWIADLLRHGLIAKSFVPPKPIRELRDLLRYRRKLVESRTAERNRLQKLLETENIKLGSVASDVFGVSGMAMLNALVRGDSTPQQMAQLAKKRLRQKLAELELALEGKFEEHHRFLLKIQLSRLEQVDEHLAQLDTRIDAKIAPYQEHRTRLLKIPGVDRVLATVIIAEIGTDMSAFKSAGHLAAWAGVCPGNNESAGKRKRSNTRRGNIHLITALVEAAHGASATKNTYLKDKFHRLKARRGYLRAAVAIGHKILTAVYVMFSKGVEYRDLGTGYLDAIDSRRISSNLVRRLQRLGYDVALTPRAQPAGAPVET
jgi:transposase